MTAVNWTEWHARYSSDPKFRADLAELARVRQEQRINRQLANAVSAGGAVPQGYAKNIMGRWAKRDKPVAKWLKSEKRRYRDRLPYSLKAILSRLGDYSLPKWRPLPDSPKDKRIAKQYDRKATPLFPVCQNIHEAEQARVTVEALWWRRLRWQFDSSPKGMTTASGRYVHDPERRRELWLAIHRLRVARLQLAA